jgi:hypothetical protein
MSSVQISPELIEFFKTHNVSDFTDKFVNNSQPIGEPDGNVTSDVYCMRFSKSSADVLLTQKA